jgi:predicted RNA-binding protein with PUA-like domain
MQKGDQALFYHSVTQKAVVGIMEIDSASFPDPTAGPDEPWVAVKVRPFQALQRPVTLQEMKSDPALLGLPLLTHTRLSVVPLSKAHFDTILAHAQRPAL